MYPTGDNSPFASHLTRKQRPHHPPVLPPKPKWNTLRLPSFILPCRLGLAPLYLTTTSLISINVRRNPTYDSLGAAKPQLNRPLGHLHLACPLPRLRGFIPSTRTTQADRASNSLPYVPRSILPYLKLLLVPNVAPLEPFSSLSALLSSAATFPVSADPRSLSATLKSWRSGSHPLSKSRIDSILSRDRV
jgi:hypothetical protein